MFSHRSILSSNGASGNTGAIHRASREVHRRAQTLKGYDRSYSLNAFGHFIQWCSKRNFSTSWEGDALERADQDGTTFEAVRREKELLGARFEVSWNFDCPICSAYESAVCELDAAELQAANIVPNRLACPSCGFVVSASDKFMSEVLLGLPIAPNVALTKLSPAEAHVRRACIRGQRPCAPGARPASGIQA